MRGDKFWPREFEEMADDPIPATLLNEPVPPENVGVLVPGRPRSLHSMLAQSLADTESLLARLEAGVAVATSGRALVRELYMWVADGSVRCWQRRCGWSWSERGSIRST